jgi:adenylate cyclase
MGADSTDRGNARDVLKKALFAGVAGALLFLLAMGLEESLGLEFLFLLRGEREPPQGVVIVTADRSSSNALSLHDDPQKWPRWIHGGLTEALSRQGAAVIAFNLLFHEPKDPQGEKVFARAITQAGNVVLSQCLQTDRRFLPAAEGQERGAVEIVQMLSPVSPLSESAAGLAPFALPKVPIKVSGCWTFKDSSGETPSLPTIAFQLYSSQAYESFARLVKKHCPGESFLLPTSREGIIPHRGIESVSLTLREVFKSKDCRAERLLAELASTDVDESARRLGRSMVNLYQGSGYRHLNFYGPAGTIPTIPYYQALNPEAYGVDVRGRAVFVGIAENSNPEHQEGFYTIFSGSDGVDLSGVEIAATAFANILEDNFLLSLPLPGQILLIVLWGGLIWTLLSALSLGRAMGGIIALSATYLLIGLLLFRGANIWLPLVVPLGLQVPLTALWHFAHSFRHTKKERENIRKAFGYHLPENIVNQLAKDATIIGKERQVINGICLCTDAQSYSYLAELFDPEELSDLMNRYYASVFAPVVRHGGLVSDVVGDSMMALWTSRLGDPWDGTRACQAALEISTCTEEFGTFSICAPLHTRIGLSAGQLVLGHLGAVTHYEYRAVGDAVNSASRIEGLNKILGTRILASRTVVMRTQGMFFRPMGVFLLSGKTQPLEVYELVCPSDAASEEKKLFCRQFTEGLRAFTAKQWVEAEEIFLRCLDSEERDGPAQFYLSLCRKHRELPPVDWKGVVSIRSK